MYFDSHAHLNLATFDKELPQIISKLKEEKIYLVNAGTCYLTSEKAIELAKIEENFWSAVGLHPAHTFKNLVDKEEIDSQDNFSLPESFDDKFIGLLKNDKVVAIGETGLDYSYLKNFSDEEKEKLQEKQREEFQKQIKASQESGLPLIIHSREVYTECLLILEKLSFKGTGVFHFFSGTIKEAKEILKRGFYLGFSGIITYDNERAKNLEEVIKETPLEKILIETDCPYAAPKPYRGQKNYPFYVQEVARKIAQIKNQSLEKIEYQTFNNALNFFKIKM